MFRRYGYEFIREVIRLIGSNENVQLFWLLNNHLLSDRVSTPPHVESIV